MIRERRGTILITSLWILAILSILALGIGFRISVEARLAKYNIDGMKALYLARAGLYKSQALLAKKTGGVDSIRQCGITLRNDDNPENSLEGLFVNVKLGEGSFTVAYNNYPGMSDEERKINLNTADQSMLALLLNSVNAASQDAAQASASIGIATAITAWKTPGDNSTEDSYYEQLGYKRKKALFSCVEELLLVRGVTPQVFNAIKDYVTVYSDKININTAPDKVFFAYGLKPEVIANIIETRNGRISGAKDGLPFADVAAIENYLPILRDNAYSNDVAIIKKYFTTKSAYFRIESNGTISKSKVEKRIVCVVHKEPPKEPALKYYREY